MYNKLFELALYTAGAAVTYFVASHGTKMLTGKHIHEHALDCFPEFKKRIETWLTQTVQDASVTLMLLKDDGRVHGKRILRAIGLWKDLERSPVMITEEIISPEQARQLGFDLNAIDDQELAYMTA